MNDIALQIAKELAKKRDGVIAEALRRAGFNGDLTELSGRATQYTADHGDVYCLDGEPIVVFPPIRDANSVLTEVDGGYYYTVTIHYQFLGAASDE